MDLAQFESLEDALERIEPGSRYTDISAGVLPLARNGMPITWETLFWFSMITHVTGVQSAIAREGRHANPHAVVPLIRTLTEAAVTLYYVLDHPEYVRALIAPPSEPFAGAPRRKSIHALISYASTQAPGLRQLYAELSEGTPYGSVPMWAAHRIRTDGDVARTWWSSEPRWRDDRAALVACAQTLELADEIERLLEAFAARHVFATVGSAAA